MHYEHYRDGKEYFHLGKCTCHGHFHRAIELVYCLRAPKAVVLDGKAMTVNEGELLFVPPFSTHVFNAAETHCSLCVVLPTACTDMFEKQTNQKTFKDLIFTDTTVARDVYEHLLLLKNTQNPLLRDGIYRYVLGMLIENGTLIENVRKQEADFAIRVLSYLEKHFAEKLTLETVSTALGYNRCYFSTVFKKNFHTGFCEYLAMLRVRKSLHLLENQPISEVAYAVGFGSLQSYYAHFKRIMGQPPAAYLARKHT